MQQHTQQPSSLHVNVPPFQYLSVKVECIDVFILSIFLDVIKEMDEKRGPKGLLHIYWDVE